MHAKYSCFTSWGMHMVQWHFAPNPKRLATASRWGEEWGMVRSGHGVGTWCAKLLRVVHGGVTWWYIVQLWGRFWQEQSFSNLKDRLKLRAGQQLMQHCLLPGDIWAVSKKSKQESYVGMAEVKPTSAEALAEVEADRPIAEGPRKTNSMNIIRLRLIRLVWKIHKNTGWSQLSWGLGPAVEQLEQQDAASSHGPTKIPRLFRWGRNVFGPGLAQKSPRKLCGSRALSSPPRHLPWWTGAQSTPIHVYSRQLKSISFQ